MNKKLSHPPLIATLLALALIPPLAHARRAIPVDVVNDTTVPIPVVVQNGTDAASQRQLVGYTEQLVNPKDGILKLNRACDNEFPGSRICTTVEIFKSVQIVESNAARGWVLPVLVPTGLTTSDGTALVMDVGTGRTNSNDRLSCRGFTAGGEDALAADDEGHIFFSRCDGGNSGVACCATVQ